MNVAVIGSNGQLGTDVVRAFTENGDSVTGLTHADVELSSADSVLTTMRHIKPQLIVNTAAMHHVEKCEADPDRAFAVNAIGARRLAVAAAEVGAVLAHISTDYVFDGAATEPYVERDLPRPLNVYGTSKLAGEHFVRGVTPRHFVLRTSAIYGDSPCRAKGGLNFIELMLKLAKERDVVRVVDSEVVSPTPTNDVAKQVLQLSRSDAYGLYHATSEGSCSWFALAHEIFRMTNTTTPLEIACQNEFPAKVPRPTYSVLENEALKKNGLNTFRHWQEGVSHYLARRARR